MTLQPDKQTIVIHILPNISRGKDNQLISMRNTFLKKSYTKYGGETISRPSSKKSKLTISVDQYSLKFYTSCFYGMQS